MDEAHWPSMCVRLQELPAGQMGSLGATGYWPAAAKCEDHCGGVGGADAASLLFKDSR